MESRWGILGGVLDKLGSFFRKKGEFPGVH